ncbi:MULTISPECIES: ABC transporter ATP-binding protein [unclassified Listeria]|uniref:ABC transporter ATP-binding protein n=1 Tax=unclassified Listeria TaxID=2642072 RepID=UPI000B58C6BE|nr:MULTISPECIES: ABC transporter ATP-binding protein [unclassified Listeria]
MSTNLKVSFKHVSKEYDLFASKAESMKAAFRKESQDSFWALKDVSFTIFEGESIGIIGINGSGKSTISSIMAGIVQATEGEVKTNGVASLIAINAGFKGPLTGLENIRLKCLMQGLTNKQIERILPDIIDFADIGDFINQPVKNYSSGMRSRLGFAVSVHIDPDILIIDEALSVGDDTFYHKCVNKIESFKAEGKTIVFVSHSLEQVKKLCDRIIWMHYGSLKEIGAANEVAESYESFVKWFNEQSKSFKKAYQLEMKAAQKSRPEKIHENPAFSEQKVKASDKWLLVSGVACLALFGTLVATGHSFLGLF